MNLLFKKTVFQPQTPQYATFLFAIGRANFEALISVANLCLFGKTPAKTSEGKMPKSEPG